jgi:uroporphyrinogen III methyltransferase/synthase
VTARRESVTTKSSPLAGRRILLTRPRDQSGELAGLLEELGATVLESPAIKIVPVADMGPLDEALRQIDQYGWIVLTSPNGARILIQRMKAAGRPHAASWPRFAAIGPGTARVLKDAGLPVEVMPARIFQAEGLLEALGSVLRRGDRILLVRAAQARPLLPDGLRALGAEVDVMVAYHTAPGDFERDRVRGWLREGLVDAVTFTSGSTVHHFVDALGTEVLRGPLRPRIVCLGSVTANAARSEGLPVDKTATRATMAALADAVTNAVHEAGAG